MEKITVSDFDAAEYIKTEEDVLAYLEAALEENDSKVLFTAIGDIARSKGMARLAKELNLSREGLYDSLSAKGNPSFGTVVKVLDNLGFRLNIERKAS
jgi:probable addiction module antidote protein